MEIVTGALDLRESERCVSRVLMVRPRGFARNEAAAESNSFMNRVGDPAGAVARAATAEFDGLVERLEEAGVRAVVAEDRLDLPDSVFPNNWISFHEPRGGGPPVIVTYPMATPARRRERQEAILALVESSVGGAVRRIALEGFEEKGIYLEGTGSLVLDRVAGVAFACRSVRTADRALDAWGEATGFEVVRFDALDGGREPIYHTNVVMALGERFAVVCSGCVADAGQRRGLLDRLAGMRETVLDITPAQMGGMCGNILELRTAGGGGGEPVVAMSETAWGAFTREQRRTLEGFARPVVAGIPTIERVGGGSVRCMIAELGSAV